MCWFIIYFIILIFCTQGEFMTKWVKGGQNSPSRSSQWGEERGICEMKALEELKVLEDTEYDVKTQINVNTNPQLSGSSSSLHLQAAVCIVGPVGNRGGHNLAIHFRCDGWCGILDDDVVVVFEEPSDSTTVKTLLRKHSTLLMYVDKLWNVPTVLLRNPDARCFMNSAFQFLNAFPREVLNPCDLLKVFEVG
jgi:hypothetical protein